ncbi:MAG: malonic semialdehyde reductase [Actinomycetaceae bacterium]|nr:malonic semialdehyde reductase [Actinomycetaceae bacterium]
MSNAKQTPTEITRIFAHMRTQRLFEPADITPERLKAVYDIIRWAPTAYNSCPMRVSVVDSDWARETLIPLMNPVNQASVRQAPAVVILSSDEDFPAGMSAMGAPESLTQTLAGRTELAESASFMQAAYYIIGLRAAGMNVGPMTGADFAGIEQEFFAGTSWKPFMVLVIGEEPQAGSERPRLKRLSADAVFNTL